MKILALIILNLIAGFLIGAILNVFVGFKGYSQSNKKYSFSGLSKSIRLNFNQFFWKQFLSLSFWMGFFMRIAIIAALVFGSKTKFENSFAIITAIYAIVSLAASRDNESSFKYELVIIGQLLTAASAFSIWYLIFPR